MIRIKELIPRYLKGKTFYIMQPKKEMRATLCEILSNVEGGEERNKQIAVVKF